MLLQRKRRACRQRYVINNDFLTLIPNTNPTSTHHVMCASKSPCHCQQHTPAEQEKIKNVLAAFQKSPSSRAYSRTTTMIGRSMSTIRLKEGYHHYRNSDSTDILEIGDESYASAEKFIYNAAHPQSDRDEKGNVRKKSVFDVAMAFDSAFLANITSKISSSRKRSINKATTVISSGHGRSSSTAKQLYDFFTCRRYVISLYTLTHIDCITTFI